MQDHFIHVKNQISDILFGLLQALILSAIVLSSVFNVSCRVTTEGIQILSGDFESPKLLSVQSESDELLSVRFSEEISVIGMSLSSVASFSKESENEIDLSIYNASGQKNSMPLSIQLLDNNTKILCHLTEKTITGQKYILYGEIEDKNGNSLTFTAPIIGYNENLARVVMTEIQDGLYSSTKMKRCEFIELYVLEPGNLSGLVISSANDGPEFDFLLPPIEVLAGQIITVHLRNSGEGCINEMSDDLSLSFADGSSNFARDLWADNTDARLGSTQDVIVLKNENTGEILDAFAYSHSSKTKWTKTACEEAALKIFEEGIWTEGSGIESAFILEGSSPFVVERKDLSELEFLSESGTFPNEFICSMAGNWEKTAGCSKASPGIVDF